MPELYRESTQNKPAITNQVLSKFCEAVDYGTPERLADILYGRYTVEDFSYADDFNYWTVHEYFLQTVVPHKIEVFKAGAEFAEQPWFFGFIAESPDLWFDNLWLHDLSKFSANESFGYAFHDFKSDKFDLGFECAWNHHVKHNEHHPQYWNNGGLLLPMPKIYIAEMVADWIGAGKVYGTSSLEGWMDKNLHRIQFHLETKQNLQFFLRKLGYETEVRDTGIYYGQIKI